MRGIIYIISSSAGLPYIGSTKQPLNERFRKHKKGGRCVSRIHIHKEDLAINVLEEGEYDSDLELRKRERYFINMIECCNVSKKPYLTPEEREKRLFRISEKNRQYDRQYEKTRLLRKLPFFYSNDF